MNCKNCGSPLRPNAKFCGVCGSPVENDAKQAESSKQESYRPAGRENRETASQESYRPASRENGISAKQESYVPGVKKTSAEKRDIYETGTVSSRKKPDMRRNQNSEVNTSEMKTIRKYFLSQKTLPLVLIILGIPLIFAVGIGLILILIGIILMFRSNFSGEDVVDRARDRQIHILKKRGLEKLNLIQDQVSLIDPIVLVGIGESPDSSFDAARADAQSRKRRKSSGIFGFFSIFGKKKSNGTENDPVEAMRIGSDECLRTMLMEVAVYVFTEQQILLYRGDVDISTGLVYSEMTAECFYQDIEGMNFSQSVYKVFNTKKKQYINKIMESFTLFLGGCKFSASINTEMNDSAVDNQLAAMRNLIRDKKNA